MVYPEKGTATLVFESSEIVDALAIFVRPIFTANKVNKNNEKIFNFLQNTTLKIIGQVLFVLN
ncbi:hypothetical protein C0V80_05795 [Leuconostoc pseudomesenteroides]|nr:hypothetical protein [Leuconostoc pseudomesenteroides]